MVKGDAEIKVTDETVRLAVQEYFDRRVGADGERFAVRSVEKSSTYGEGFIVKIAEMAQVETSA